MFQRSNASSDVRNGTWSWAGACFSLIAGSRAQIALKFQEYCAAAVSSIGSAAEGRRPRRVCPEFGALGRGGDRRGGMSPGSILIRRDDQPIGHLDRGLGDLWLVEGRRPDCDAGNVACGDRAGGNLVGQ